MSRQATKACGNRYYEARMRAAKYNEKLLTRAGAIDYLPGVTEDSLKKYELDITRPPNIVVALMADAYNEPELRAWYCVNECPLGKDCREIPEMPAERALIRLQNSVYEMEQLTRQLSLLMEVLVVKGDNLYLIKNFNRLGFLHVNNLTYKTSQRYIFNTFATIFIL